MKVNHLHISGVAEIVPSRFGDERGYFSPVYNPSHFKNHGLHTDFCRLNQSFSALKGTLRGIHYQRPPNQEAKLLRVLQGKVWDLALDIRPNSPTFGQHVGVYLDAEQGNMLHLPAGTAHAFITLTENVLVEYLCSNEYTPSNECSIRWNDPFFSINWPIEPINLSEKDAQAPDFNPKHHLWPEHPLYQ